MFVALVPPRRILLLRFLFPLHLKLAAFTLQRPTHLSSLSYLSLTGSTSTPQYLETERGLDYKHMSTSDCVYLDIYKY